MLFRLLLKKNLCLWLIFVGLSAGSWAKPDLQDRPLSEVLDQISERYQVIFTYDASIVEGIRVDFEFEDVEVLESAVNRALKPTGLRYRFLGEKYYIIFKDTRSGNRKAKKLAQNIRQIQRLEKSDDISLEKSTDKKKTGKLFKEVLEKSAELIAERQISGTVKDPEGVALVGATVRVKDASIGALTDQNGRFELTIPDDATTLIISYVGFSTQEIEIGNQTSFSISMEVAISELEDVIVIGYGTKTKADITGAVSSIDADEIAKSDLITPELAMQGRMPGVFVATPSGDPNARPEVRIRGVGTIGFNDPLFVIDGVPVTEFGSGTSYTNDPARTADLRGTLNVFNLINPNDIESISVLKDASAAAIYGVRAANGVVLITTKRGRSGKPTVSFKISAGIANVPNTFDVLNTQEFTALHQEMYNNNPAELANIPAQFVPDSAQFLGNNPTYDWQDAVLNDNALTQDYAMTISGGNLASTYAISGGYSYTESPLKFNETERYTVGINSDHQLTPWLKIGESLRIAYIDAIDQRNITGVFADLRWGSGNAPWQPIFDPNGPAGFAPNRIVDPNNNFAVIDGLPYGPETDFNLLGLERFTDNDWTQIRNLGSAYVEVEPLSGLTVKGTLSIDWFYTRRNQWQDINALNFRDGDPTRGNIYSERHNRNHNFTRELAINYNKIFGDHSLDILVNGMWQDYGVEVIFSERDEVFSTDPALRLIQEGDRELSSVGTVREEYALQGYLGRLSYNYKGKYYLDATIRRDGTSRFAPDSRWGTFPSFSAAWRISEEDFMASVGWIDDLKFRGGWGRLGNQETRAYAFLSLVSLNPRYPTGPGPTGSNNEAVFLPDFPVLDLGWETATTTSVGFDGLFFNNSLSVTVEYYNRLTEGILQAVALPLVVGNTQDPVFNIASVRNRGIEVAVGYNKQFGEVGFNIGGNLTTVDNEVVELAGGDPFGGNTNRIEEGFPLNYLWGYQASGIFQTQEEVNAYLSTTSDQLSDDTRRAPGDLFFEDIYGPATEEGEFRTEGADGVVNTLDQTYLGKTIPGYFYGFNVGANWRGFDLSVFFQGIGDVQKYNEIRRRGESMSGQGVNQWTTTNNRWTPTNPSTTFPRAMASDPTGNTRFSSRWIEDAGFMRLKNFQLGYTLAPSALRALGNAKNIRIYVSGTNTLLFTNWSGVDPENDRVPPPRIFTVGLNLTY
ncbi:MAG: SusC/RagA family TonB-linked outer membrane protein [Bacteroidota bacterium]